MSESIFSSLFRYRASEKMSPKENYLTEMICWLINNCPTFANEYLKSLYSKNKELENEIKNVSVISAETQVYINNTDNIGFIDMVITTNTDLVLICEHKIDSSLSEGQLDKYRKSAGIKWNNKNTRIVLVTKSDSQWGQNPDIKLIWEDIYSSISNKEKREYIDNTEQLFIEQFLLYLTEEGMGMKKGIEKDCLRYYKAAESLPNTLNSFFNGMVHDFKINKYSDFTSENSFSNFSEGFGMSVNNRWGRIGIDCFKEWKPLNIFAGVILNGEDHKLKDLDQPIFVIIIDCLTSIDNDDTTQKNRKEHIESRIKSSNFEQNGFEVDINPKSPWRLLILKKNLSDIIKSNDPKIQEKILKNEVIKGINLILDNCK